LSHRSIHKAVLEKVSIFKLFEMENKNKISQIELQAKQKVNKIKLDELMEVAKDLSIELKDLKEKKQWKL
jgi:hypothetical protein